MMESRIEQGINILSNYTIGSYSLVLLLGGILTLVGFSEIKSLSKDLKFPEHHKKYHIILIILLIVFPSFLTIQLIRVDLFFVLLSKGFWISFLLYDSLAFYLLVHLREERKGDVLDILTIKSGVKVILKKIKDLFV